MRSMSLQHKLEELREVILQLQKFARYQSELAAELSNIDDIPSPQHTEYQLDDLGVPSECGDIMLETPFREQELRIAELLVAKQELERMVEEHRMEIERLKTENEELSNRVGILRNEVIEMRGMIRVVCRVLPGVDSTKVRCGDRFVEVDSKKFVVDRAFGQGAGQVDVYREFASLVESVLEGYRVCIFAYGQTGSGKTYTMSGVHGDQGIIYRAFDNITRAVRALPASDVEIEYNLRYLEIYNDTVRDLIGNQQVQILDEGSSLRLKNCECLVISNLDGMNSILEEVGARRHTGETCCNSTSSRSHSLVILTVTLRIQNEVREGALVLVDLAGSERLNESKAKDERLKETQHINKSLSALGNVFTALKRGDKHVPFRDSRLTHVMREYLVGRSRTAMIVNINPANVSETLNSMRFASKVSECALGSAETNVHFIN